MRHLDECPIAEHERDFDDCPTYCDESCQTNECICDRLKAYAERLAAS